MKNGAAGSAIDQASSAESDGLVSSVSHANAAIGTWKKKSATPSFATAPLWVMAKWFVSS